jgi:hypothetical protein
MEYKLQLGFCLVNGIFELAWSTSFSLVFAS